MPRHVRRLPADDRTNGWSALLSQRTPNLALKGDAEFDWVVVGAGFAGVAAARQLAIKEPRASIALVEAGQVGENASGRNSGFAIDLPHAPSTTAEGLEQGRRAIRIGCFAIDAIDDLVRSHGIDCDWQRRGRFHAAVTPEISKRALKTYAANLETWKQPFDWLDRSAIEEQLGTKYYDAAIYTPGTYLMNPAALIRGLADCLPAQVSVFESTPVVEFDFSARSPFIRTPHGRIRFGKLILAVNAFSQSFGVFESRQVPVLLFASLTKPLTPEQLASLGSNPNWGLTPAHGVAGSTLRLTSDGRLLIRHGFDYSPTLRTDEARRDAARRFHGELLQRRFPQLADLEIEHFWMGWLAVSQNHAPAFGRINENVYAASCCNGSGIVRHTAAGLLIADQALGLDNPLIADFLVQGTASYIPPRPIRDLGVRLKLKWDMANGKAEE